MTKVALSRFGLITLLIFFRSVPAISQSAAQIISDLQNINRELVDLPCNTGQGKLIANKAMNIFLSNKVSSYLSDKSDLSLYKNYVTIDAAKGVITINHNLHQPVDSDDYVKSFIVIGARVGFANAYAARFSNSYNNNQLGFNIQKIWMGKPITKFDLCGNQKQAMDAQRALILQRLVAEITVRVADFQRELADINSADIPQQNLEAVRLSLSLKFFTALKEEYLQKFAENQSELMVNSNNYNAIKDNWTTLGVYLPVIAQKFQLFNDAIQTNRYSFPVEFTVTHTRFWDMPKTGRIFLSFGVGASINNSVQGGQLLKSSIDGTYAGLFKNYLTPATSGKVIYLPPDSHVGISLRLEKNFGNYSALNGIIGIPIVLIDKKGVPAVNFECQVILNDINHSLQGQLSGNSTSIGLTVGIPFSKIVY